MMTHFSPSSFIVGLMFGALLAGAWFLRGDSVFVPFSSSPPLTTNTVSLSPVSGTVSVVDQPAGDSVLVESVTVPTPSVWVAVREMNGNDLGNVLGAARVGGPRNGVVVPLLRATEPARPYAVELYRDDHDGRFDPAGNSVYIDFDTGAPAVAYFKTTD